MWHRNEWAKVASLKELASQFSQHTQTSAAVLSMEFKEIWTQQHDNFEFFKHTFGRGQRDSITPWWHSSCFAADMESAGKKMT